MLLRDSLPRQGTHAKFGLVVLCLIKRPLHAFRRRGAWLFMDQLFSSGSNALLVLAGAWVLQPEALASVAMVQMIAVFAMGIQRSLLLEPALSLQGDVSRFPVSVGKTLLLCIGATGSAVAVLAVVSIDMPWYLCCCIGVPLFQDSLRYRSLGFGRIRRVVLSDGVWLVTLASLMAFFPPASSSEATIYWCATSFVGMLPLCLRFGTRGASSVSVMQCLRRGVYQTIDFALGAATYLLPMLLIVPLALPSLVGAYRLAQIFLGPLSSVSAALVIHALLRSNALSRADATLVRSIVRSSKKRLLYLVSTYGVFAVAFGLVYSYQLPDDIRNYFLRALIVTVVGSLVAAPSILYVAYLRASGNQRASIGPRAVTLMATLVLFALGILGHRTMGLDPLLLPVAFTPVVSAIAWHVTYSRRLDGLSVRKADSADTNRSEEHAYE
jgi:hypothetical protein